MMIREQIEAKLRAAFDPMYLEVVDESYRHNVPAGSESHFKVVLVSDRFTGERFLNRHRMIYGTLTEELSNTVHALALHTYTIKEWEALSDKIKSFDYNVVDVSLDIIEIKQKDKISE